MGMENVAVAVERLPDSAKGAASLQARSGALAKKSGRLNPPSGR
jgi:hypothetical protein